MSIPIISDRTVEYRLIFNFCLLISKVSSFKTLREVFVKLPILFYYGSKRHTNTELWESFDNLSIVSWILFSLRIFEHVLNSKLEIVRHCLMDLLLDVTCSVSEDCNMSPVALEMISGEAVKFPKSSYMDISFRQLPSQIHKTKWLHQNHTRHENSVVKSCAPQPQHSLR